VNAYTPFNPGDLLFLLKGALVTLQLCVMAITLGTVVAFPVGILRTLPGARLLQLLAVFYIEIFRSTPLLLQLFVVYFGLSIFGFNVSRPVAAGVAMTLYASAFMGEIIRAGIQAIPRGQWEAGRSIGLTYLQQLRYVILPQAVKIMTPAVVSFMVSLIKASSLTSIIGFMELSRIARLIVERTMSSFLVFAIVALFYFLMCYPLSLLGRRLEQQVSR
jgi:polar amino acid transport system permease protein